jgi:hypothetical protein
VMGADLEHRDWPVCPHCGHANTGAWEWNFGPGLEGSGAFECARCGGRMHVERWVTVTYTTVPLLGEARAAEAELDEVAGSLSREVPL